MSASSARLGLWTRTPDPRAAQRQVANRLAEQILAGFASEGDAVVVDAAPGGGVTLETVPAGEPLPERLAARLEAGAEAPDDGMETAAAPFATAGEA